MDNRSSYEKIQQLRRNRMDYVPLGDSPIEELGLKYRGQADLDELRFILGRIFTYPSTELAELHKDANRLGQFDIKNDGHAERKLQDFDQYRNVNAFCPDCGFVRQPQDHIRLCTSINEVSNVGVSIYLYFHTLKGLSVILLLGFLMYGIYALITNIMAANEFRSVYELADIQGIYDSFSGILVLSLGSKQTGQQFSTVNRTYFLIQCWIGMGMVILWGIIFVIIKYLEEKGVQEAVNDLKSVADFSITIENIPENMTEDQLERQLTAYQKQILQDYPEAFSDIQIITVNLAKPFYLDKSVFKKEEIKEVNKKYNSLMEEFTSWIKERRKSNEFSVPYEKRMMAYNVYEKTKEKQERLVKEVTEEVKNSFAEQRGNKTVAFVTLRSTQTQRCLLRKNQEDFSSSIRETLFFCCKKRRKFMLTDSQGNKIQTFLKQAPEPEDIIWTNLGQSKCRLIVIKTFSFFIALLILGGSFAAVYALSKIRVDLENQEGNTSSYYYSFLISLVIPIFNLIIQQVLKRLSYLERDYTTTVRQASIAVKGTFASLINSILVPILVNYYFKEKNLYGVNGLSYDVFLLGITNSFFPAIIRIFDVYFYLTRLVALIANKPTIKLRLCQNQVNFFTEYMEFEPGYDMIPIVNSFLFTCFFAALQPIIIIFAFFGMVLMFWTQKYSLYNRCKRPAPGNRTINTAMYSMILLGPLFYALGSFCWSHFFNQNIDIPITPNLLASIFAFIVYILPYSFIVIKIRGDKAAPDNFYQNNKIFFPTEYDRMNPSTSQKAVKQYVQYVAQYKKHLIDKYKDKNSMSKQQIANKEREFFYQMRRGKYTKNDKYINRLGQMIGNMAEMQESKILDNMFAPDNKYNNIHLLGSTIFGDIQTSENQYNRRRKVQMPIQNWATYEEIHKFQSRIAEFNDDNENSSQVLYNKWEPKNKNNNHKKLDESPHGLINRSQAGIESKQRLGRPVASQLEDHKPDYRSEMMEINSTNAFNYPKNFFHPTNPFAIDQSGINSGISDDEPMGQTIKKALGKKEYENIFGREDKKNNLRGTNKTNKKSQIQAPNQPPIFQENSDDSK